ncbi:MAG: methyltransferase domain-containing protein [Candidatus Omnitrophota bacterium]
MNIEKSKQINIVFKMTALTLVQVFWLANFAWCGPAAESIFPRQPQDTLSPRLHLNRQLFQAGFSRLTEQSLPPAAQTTAEFELHFEANSFREGYKKLNILLTSIKKNKKRQLILCVEGDVSAGKTTFVRTLLEKEIAGFSRDGMLNISLDDILNSLQKEEDLSALEAMLEGPFILEKKLKEAGTDKQLIILEGAEMGHYLEKAGYTPDVIVNIKAPKETRLKRHLMRYGVFALKFFNELYLKPYFPENVPVIEIQNNDWRDISWISVILKMSLKTVQIILVGSLKFVVSEDKLDSIRGLNILLLPFRIGVYGFGRLVDFYFGLKPARSIIPIIKERFQGKVRVLDVGTGAGEFVEKFQRILDKNNMPASVSGIDNNPKRVALGLRAGRNLKVMDIENAEKHLGRNSFDIINISAPDRPADFLVEESMKLLKKDGMLILRLHKGHHYDMFFGRDYRVGLIQELKKSFEVEDWRGHIHNLPTGEWHRLYPPLIVRHKQQKKEQEEKTAEPASGAEVISFNDVYFSPKARIQRLLKNGKLDEAYTNLKRLKEINENVSEIQPDVTAALKYRADKRLEEGLAQEALVDYQRILWLLPSERDMNFYIGFCHFELGQLVPAYIQFKAAANAGRGEVLYALAVLVAESILLIQNVKDDWEKVEDKKWGAEKFLFADASMQQLRQRIQPQMEYILSELQGDYLQVIQGSILWSQIYDALLEAYIESQTEYEDFLQGLGFSANVDYLDSSFALPSSPRPGNDNSQSNRSDRVIHLEQRLQAKIGGEGVNVRKLNPLPKWPKFQLIDIAI